MLKSWVMEEILVVDKPKGWTSHDVVDFYRRKLGIKKIGHAGTLDPFATGVLVLLVGKATKRFEEFKKLDKEYEMVVEFGWATDTGDPEGKIVEKMPSVKTGHASSLTHEKIKSVLSEFLGEYEQTVPAFSAVKHKGKPLYKYARRGEKVDLPKRKVEIKEIELLDLDIKSRAFDRVAKPGFEKPYPRLKIRVVCSSGTYMRQLAIDIGKRLGVPAVAVELRRTRVGNYTLDEAARVEP